MEKLLADKESGIWEFPKFPILDSSITKYDHVTVYEDHHGSGTLENADNFSFTTENDDIWLLPAESYLKLDIQVKKADGRNYRWVNRAAVPAEGGNAAVPAADADEVDISDNGFNLFSDARLYLGDQEIERIDHVGIATLLTNLMELDKKYELKNTRHTEINFFQNSTGRQAYLRKVRGNWHLQLPIKKLFSFFRTNDHVFRGTKFRINLSFNNSDNLLVRNPEVAAGKVQIKNMKWMIPYVEPSLDVMAKLESQLAKNATYKLGWNAKTVYKHQPPRQIDVRLPLASSVHKPTHVYVILQDANRLDNQEQVSMFFNNMNLEECYTEVNGLRFPDRPIKVDFLKHEYTELYSRFLNACEEGDTYLDYETFGSTYPIIHFDISKHPEHLYENTNFPTITLYLKFRAVPANNYVAWVIVENEREATLNLDNKRMIVVR